MGNYAQMEPSQREARKKQMRLYSNARYHRMRAEGHHFKSRKKDSKPNNNKSRKDFINAYKVNRGFCVDCYLPCELWNVVMFAFDHLDPSQKSFTIAKAREFKPTVEQLVHEMEKCELVCHNCHAWRTWIDRAHDGVKRQQTTMPLPLLEMMYATD